MNTREKIISIIEELKTTAGAVSPESNLYTGLGFDSLAFVQLLIIIEEVFSISIEITEMETCLQVDRLIALVESKIEGGRA